VKKVAGAAALAVALAGLLGACGGDSAKSPADATTTTPKAAVADFEQLFDDLAQQSYKVTYTDPSGQSVTFAQDGNGNTVTAGANKQVFTTRTSAITCEKPDGAGEFTCEQTPITMGADSSYIASAIAENTYATALDYRFRNTTAKSIAGRDADCFSITAGDFDGVGGIAGRAGGTLKGTTTYCNDRETGALLENTITSADGDTHTQLLVTEFEQPSPSDFEPPAVPTVVTTPGGAVTQPGGVG
jgi:hypothetical protein